MYLDKERTGRSFWAKVSVKICVGKTTNEKVAVKMQRKMADKD